ncbi:MAG: hypothetical protein K2W96_28540 [Gemmataceae bacterium]|nr:hypothetical protein [Gemmataceae bacterium]
MPVNRFPRPTEAPPVPDGFVACPEALRASWPDGECPWKEVYEVALDRARRVVAPPLAERLSRHLDN